MARLGIATMRDDLALMSKPQVIGGSGYDLVASVAVPLRFGKIVVSPELQIGYGHLSYQWVLRKPSGSISPELSGDIDDVRYGTRISVARWIGGGFSVNAAIAVDILPTRYDKPVDYVFWPGTFEYNPAVRFAIGIRH